MSLRGKKINGLRFRRQHPLSKFIIDFYCHKKRLVIEIDGKIHNMERVKERDDERTIALEQFGLKIIRFKNEEVLNNLDKVVKRIIKEL